MRAPRSLAWLTAEYFGDKSYSINYHLTSLIPGAAKALGIRHVGIHSHSLSASRRLPLAEVLSGFDLALPDGLVSCHRDDIGDIRPLAETIAEYDVVVAQMYTWADVLEEARAINPGLTIIAWVHSLLLHERNVGNRHYGPLFDFWHQRQKKLLSLADHVVFDSDFDLEICRSLYGMPPGGASRIHPVPAADGREVEAHRFAGNGLPNVRLAYLGRWEVRKGVETLLEAFCQCHAGDGMTLTIVSDFDPRRASTSLFSTPEAARRFDRLVKRGAIRIAGWKRSRRDYLHFLRTETDLVVIPSLYDPFNIIAYDCLANGVPLVVSRMCGVRELIPDNAGSAVLINPYDAGELYDTVMGLGNAMVAGRAIERIEPRYRLEDAVREFADLLERIVPRRA